MAYFIIIRGPLGIGKTTIAKKLAGVLKAEHISFDLVLEKYKLDKCPPNAPCIPAANFIKADNIILPKIKKILKKKNVIFDGCFYHKKHIQHLIKSLHYPNYVFTLKAPVSVCISRDLQRKKTLGKDSAKAVHWLCSKFDYGIVIKTSRKTAGETVREIIDFLKSIK
jgi:broad-specificity NMP kinase